MAEKLKPVRDEQGRIIDNLLIVTKDKKSKAPEQGISGAGPVCESWGDLPDEGAGQVHGDGDFEKDIAKDMKQKEPWFKASEIYRENP